MISGQDYLDDGLLKWKMIAQNKTDKKYVLPKHSKFHLKLLWSKLWRKGLGINTGTL